MEEGAMNVEVIWRGTKMNVAVNRRWTIGDLGVKLVEMTNIKPDTLKLIAPQIDKKGSRLLAPFSDDDSSLRIQETGIIKGKPVKMMGVFDDEIKEASQHNMRPDLRIAGFEEEDNRLRQLSSYKSQVSLKLPQGPYIFCDFRTLELPGIKLNPPPSKALRIMQILACDQGIVAIMNKHRWRVGVMTELAPVGYVGISPKCILGFNKNHGEEISLRLRTDDLKGFRKFESIKKTLLHELAHMIHSEHDTKFLSLEKQLNEEAESLDWSKSKSRTLSGRKVLSHYEDIIEDHSGSTDVGLKLGGSISSATARASSVAAAHNRYLNSSILMKIEEPEPRESVVSLELKSENIELQRIEEPAAAICARIQEILEALRSELSPLTAFTVLQALTKIIGNILEHPDELKFRRIRKANVQFQRNIANYKAAMEVLRTVGFNEDVELDAIGNAEAFLVLKKNDPGLLWLAKSSLEVFIF